MIECCRSSDSGSSGSTNPEDNWVFGSLIAINKQCIINKSLISWIFEDPRGTSVNLFSYKNGHSLPKYNQSKGGLVNYIGFVQVAAETGN